MTNKELYTLFKSVWDIKNIFLFDSRYTDISKDDLDKELKEVQADPHGYADCDKFALQLYALVKDRHPQWPFGRVMGLIGQHSGPHAVNICVCDNKVYLIEPKRDPEYVWKADPNKDKIKFIEV